jgi:hypothetical protein
MINFGCLSLESKYSIAFANVSLSLISSPDVDLLILCLKISSSPCP